MRAVNAPARILLFAKSPTPGQAKTRLIPLLGADGAADLQARLCRSACRTAVAAGLGPVELWTMLEHEHELFAELCAELPVERFPQNGSDLGARMHFAAEAGLAKSGPVILIGTDCPDLTVEYLHGALEQLQAGAEVVIGAAEDGGYVLLGLSRLVPEIFEEMPWGTDRVLSMTLDRLRELDCSFATLPALRDLDRPEDYQSYFGTEISA